MTNSRGNFSLTSNRTVDRGTAFHDIQKLLVTLRHGKATILSGILLFALFCGPRSTPVADAQARPVGETGKNSAEVARGKYLVESVAMCGECHTPRDSKGGVDRSRWLQGASVRWSPVEAGGSDWPLIAPRIGGTPPASDADMIRLLTTGIWTTGKPLRFPMMPFRMTQADARAVVAYLRALTPQN